MSGVLTGVRVAAFTHFAAGPLAAQFLGDLGADVVKIEAPWRDLNRYCIRDPEKLSGISPYFLATNRNQRCLVVDMKQAAGLAVVRRLVERADVLLENHRPGAMARLGLGYAQVKGFNPDIVYASNSAYGQDGPGRDDPGQDLLLQARTGIASLTGRGDGPPVPVGAYVIDAYASLLVVIGVLSALRHRDATGEGQWIQADMMAATMHLMAQEASYAMNLGVPPVRSRAGIAHVDQPAPYGVYQTADGYVVMSLGDVASVTRVGEALGVLEELRPYLTERGLRANRDEVAGAIATGVRRLSTAELTTRMAHTGVWVAPIRTLLDALQDPVVIHQQLIKQLSSPYGAQYRVVGNPLKLSGTPIDTFRPAPAAGEHSVAVLRELGYTATEIEGLLASKAVVQWAGGGER